MVVVIPGTLEPRETQDSEDQHQPPPWSQISHWDCPCGVLASLK